MNMLYIKNNGIFVALSLKCVLFLQASLQGGNEKANSLISRFLQRSKTKKIAPELRAFALTLHFYSAKAYDYVRKTFNNSLPHPRTLTRWYQTIDGAPGFTQEAFLALQHRAEEARKKGFTIICNLVMDEMAIRKNVEWTGKKFTGFVDFGGDIQGDNQEEAKEALVFLLVAINDFFKIPVAYFFISSLNAEEKANLVGKVLEHIHESGILVTSFTFDGAITNLNMARVLGANFEDPNNLRTHFPHPVTGKNVHIFLDPCHMLKLWRNCLASQGTLQDEQGRDIKWSYFQKLVDLQTLEGLHLGTKIRNRHLMWTTEKMKVKTAAQTFSNSVADAFIFLQNDLNHPDFESVTATAHFTKTINNLFDVFNVKNRFGKAPYRKPLSKTTKDQIFDFLDYCSQYIKGLKLKGINILYTNRKTGFLGFLICIQSLKNIFFEYCSEKQLLKYLLTYKFSQDHLEIFFSAVRTKGGSNNNPTARMFEIIYKKLLVHTEVRGSETANAVSLDDMPILYNSSRCISRREDGTNLLDSEEYRESLESTIEISYLASDIWHLTTYVEDVVSYIAGYVLKSLKKGLSCIQCLKICSNENNESISMLQERKTFGSLQCASKALIDICKHAEKILRFEKSSGKLFIKKFDVRTFIKKIIYTLPPHIYLYFEEHSLEENIFESHTNLLITLILEIYLKIRIHYETSKINDKKETRIRSKFTKAVLFQNQ